MAIFYFRNWIVAAETIEGGMLFMEIGYYLFLQLHFLVTTAVHWFYGYLNLSIDLAVAEGQQNNESYHKIQIGGVSQLNILVPLHAINYKNTKPARLLGIRFIVMCFTKEQFGI